MENRGVVRLKKGKLKRRSNVSCLWTEYRDAEK